jgi:hypothetical protein
MTTKRTLTTRSWPVVITAGVLLSATSCDFLEVENTTAPDREDATASPTDLEAFMAGGFHPNMFNALHDDEDATAAFPLQASEFSATMQGQNTLLQYNDHAAEPRGVHDNGVVVSLGNGPQGPRDVWATVHEANSVAHDGLEILAEGEITIMDGSTDVTPRARAFAKLIQGWSWGYLGLVFDQAHVVPETVAIPQDPGALLEVTLQTLVPYDSVISAAVNALEDAIEIAQQNPGVVQYPSYSESNLWFGTPEPLSNAKFIELANTLAARFLVLAARSPAERDQVDWARVLAFTTNGLTSDFEVELDLTGARNSTLINHFVNDPGNERNYRWDYRAIGPADQSGAYQAWVASPLGQRDRFDIVTPDRRITGPEPTSNGSYTAYYADDNGFVPERGTYAYSAYQWRRHAFELGIVDELESGFNMGTAVFVSVAENNLLRAEAYARTGAGASAVDLVNMTRTATQTIDGVDYPGLEPVTAAGVPESGGVCVPRLDSGACGDLLAAIRYERMVELAALDMIRGYADSRGWGTLADGTPIHYPVPGNALDLYGLDNYTYGGSGPGSATYDPTP